MPYDESGGGFLSQNNNDSGSQEVTTTKYEQTSVRPVTIKQILDATSSNAGETDNLIIDKEKVNKIKMVGILRNITTSTGRAKYIVEDGTGSVQLIDYEINDQPIDQSQNSENSENSPTIGDYVEAYAFSKLASGHERLLYVTHLRIITDYNAVIFHFLEVIKTHLYLTKGPIDISKPKPKEAIFMEDDDTNAEDVRNAVLGAIENYGDKETGCYIDTLYETISYPRTAIDVQVQALHEEGKIYQPAERYFSTCY